MSDVITPPARPTRYGRRAADRLCQAVATVSLNMAQIIAADPTLPSEATIQRWFARHEAFRDAFELACERRAEGVLEACADIAATLRQDVAGYLAQENGQALAEEALKVARLEIDKRMKVVERLAPRLYASVTETAEDEVNGDCVAAGDGGSTVH